MSFQIYNFKLLDNKCFTAIIVLSNEATFHLTGTMAGAALDFGEQQSLCDWSY